MRRSWSAGQVSQSSILRGQPLTATGIDRKMMMAAIEL
jgi:hypothetical protein